MNVSKVIYILMLLITVLGAVNWGLVPSGNNLVERFIPARYTSHVYYIIAFAGLMTLVLYTRMNSGKTEEKSDKK